MLLLSVTAFPLGAQEKPVLSITLLDETQYSGSIRTQAGEINRFLGTLNDLLPELQVEIGRRPSRRADFRLSFVAMNSTEDYLKIEASYTTGSDEPTEYPGIFTEPCSATLEASHRCFRASPAKRAERAVASLLDDTILHWDHGIYRIFEVRDCESLPPIGVALQVSPASMFGTYREPSFRFDYMPGVIVQVGGRPYPVPTVGLLLRRGEKLGTNYAFSRLGERPEELNRFCLREEDRVLLHRYQLLDLSSGGNDAAAPPMPIGINSSPPGPEGP